VILFAIIDNDIFERVQYYYDGPSILSPVDLILHTQRSHLCINSLVVSTFHFMTNHQMVDYRSYSKEARIHEVAFVATGLIGLR